MAAACLARMPGAPLDPTPSPSLKPPANALLPCPRPTPASPRTDAAVKAVLSEYRIHNADVHVKGDYDVDDLVDVIEGNRIYVPCIYVINKIDQVQCGARFGLGCVTACCARGPATWAQGVCRRRYARRGRRASTSARHSRGVPRRLAAHELGRPPFHVVGLCPGPIVSAFGLARSRWRSSMC